MKYDNNRDCNYFELTLIRLLYILVMSRIGIVDENEQLKQQVKQLQHWNRCLAEKRHNELKGDVE